MTKPIVLVTAPIEPVAERALRKWGHAIIAPDAKPETLREFAKQAHAILACTPLPDDIFEHAPNIFTVVRHGAGVDIIPVAEATRRGIPVANVPGMNAGSVAEHCIGAMFELVRGYAKLDRDTRELGWNEARRRGGSPTELRGKIVNIIGVGAVGQRVAEIAHRGLEMDVRAYRRANDRLPAFISATTLDEAFETSDFLVLSCPLTDETLHLVDAFRLRQMRSSAFLINVARGAIIDEDALVEALRERRIAGAALDVFTEEPLPANHPLLGLDNVLITPHRAGASREGRAAVGLAAVEELRRILSRERPLHPVNPEVLEEALKR